MVLRNADVFKLWQRDKPETLVKTYDLDFELSKLASIVKNTAALEDIRSIFIANYDYIKDVFLTLTINSGTFPYLGLQDFARFVKEIGLMDSEVVTNSRITFITASVKAKPKQLDFNVIKGQPGNEMNRAEFIEVLVRLAITKYGETTVNTADCV